MKLDIAHAARINPSCIHYLPIVVSLGAGVRLSNGKSLCRLVCECRINGSQNIIIVCHSILQSLDDNGCEPFRSAVSVGILVPNLALTGLREEMAFAEHGKVIGVRDKVQATSDRSVELSGPESIAGCIYGGQATRARCIHIEGWTTKFEEVLNSAVGKASLASRNGVSPDVLTGIYLSVVIASLAIVCTDTAEGC
jgi:hypothetical protein